MEQSADTSLLDWIHDQASHGDVVKGFDVTGWEASIWILHSMYEHERQPARDVGPGPGRHRVRWLELARRLDVDPFEGRTRPSHRSFPDSKLPEMVVAPSEGRLLPWELRRLVDHLVDASSAREESPCVVFYGTLAAAEFDELVIFTGELGDLVGLHETMNGPAGPSNIWPHDKSWFVYTDYDLWGTKVSGSAELVAALSGDSELKTVALDV